MTSSKPLNTKLSNSLTDIPCYSAGHTKHEWTSWACIDALFPFLEEKYAEFSNDDQSDESDQEKHDGKDDQSNDEKAESESDQEKSDVKSDQEESDGQSDAKKPNNRDDL